MLDVGIVGLGEEWESRYRPAMCGLRDRLCVRAIYDPVANRAEQAAAEFNAQTPQGILTLAASSNVQALLLLEDGWFREAALAFAVAHRKPVYCGGGLRIDGGGGIDRHRPADAVETFIMPELRLRYTPASGRLRELLATRLGRPQEISIDVEFSAPAADIQPSDQSRDSTLLIELIDWCHYLVGTAPESVQYLNGRLDDPTPSKRDAEIVEQARSGLPPSADVLPHGDDEADSHPEPGGRRRTIAMQFRKSQRGGDRTMVRVSLPADERSFFRGTVTGSDVCLRVKVACDHGTAILDGKRLLKWEHGGTSRSETLSGERDAIGVLLDLFCRRVMGGLIPVPLLVDIDRAAAIVRAAEQSRLAGRAIAIDRWPAGAC